MEQLLPLVSNAIEASSLEQIQLEQRLNIERVRDGLFRGLTRFFALLVLAILVAILAALFAGSMPSIKAFGFRFFVDSSWNPVTNRFGALVPMVGTVVTSAIALLIAVPISFGIALFLTEIAPRSMKTALGVAIELLAAIPSIIYGMWGLFIFAPFFAKHIQPWLIENFGTLPFIGVFFQGAPMGIGLFTAALILAIMIIPFIAAVMRDVFEVVPSMLKESAYGLGSTKWEVARNIILPYTRVGVMGGVILGLGRALGETMAVTFVIGNAHELSASLFMPGNTISSALANEFTEAVGALYTSSLIELGLILFVITFVVLAIAKVMILRVQKQSGARP